MYDAKFMPWIHSRKPEVVRYCRSRLLQMSLSSSSLKQLERVAQPTHLNSSSNQRDDGGKLSHTWNAEPRSSS